MGIRFAENCGENKGNDVEYGNDRGGVYEFGWENRERHVGYVIILHAFRHTIHNCGQEPAFQGLGLRYLVTRNGGIGFRPLSFVS